MMKRITVILLVIITLFSTSALAERIDITADNFEEYFNVSLDVGNIKTKSSYSGATYDISGDVTMTIDAKSPFKIFDVSFNINAVGGVASEGHVWTYDNIEFAGNMPQNGSYSNTKSVSINTFLGESLKYNYATIKSANGYIDIGDATENNDKSIDSVADEIIKLGELLDKGLITQEEFDAQKAKLLGN